MAVTPASFKARFSEFTSVDDSVIQLALDEASMFTNKCQLGNKYELAVMYQSAHNLATSLKATVDGVTSPSGVKTKPTGNIVREDILEWSASYDIINAFRNSEYSLTTYGLKYKQLLKSCFPSRVCVRGGGC